MHEPKVRVRVRVRVRVKVGDRVRVRVKHLFACMCALYMFLTYLPVQDSDFQCKTPMQDFSVLHCYDVI
jgi:hypothetical protein